MPTPYRVDVHAHFPIDLNAVPGAGGPPWSAWDTASAVDRLDRLQITRQYLSLPALPRDRTGAGSGATLAGAVNDRFASIIQEEAFYDLDAPIEIVAGLNIPIPFNLELEKASVPQKDDIVAAVLRSLHAKPLALAAE